MEVGWLACEARIDFHLEVRLASNTSLPESSQGLKLFLFISAEIIEVTEHLFIST